MNLSRSLAQKAQKRESITIQPKEKLTGIKATITIKNYLGGYYYFTSDEAEINKNNVYLIEGKHTKTADLPSLNDIKDGLLKMILFTNLEDVKVNGVGYKAIPLIKLTTGKGFKLKLLNKLQIKMLKLLRNEAKTNGFRVLINKKLI